MMTDILIHEWPQSVYLHHRMIQLILVILIISFKDTFTNLCSLQITQGRNICMVLHLYLHVILFRYKYGEGVRYMFITRPQRYVGHI
jgi:hypothetical protein